MMTSILVTFRLWTITETAKVMSIKQDIIDFMATRLDETVFLRSEFTEARLCVVVLALTARSSRWVLERGTSENFAGTTTDESSDAINQHPLSDPAIEDALATAPLLWQFASFKPTPNECNPWPTHAPPRSTRIHLYI
jgi:hypothetical protein